MAYDSMVALFQKNYVSFWIYFVGGLILILVGYRIRPKRAKGEPEEPEKDEIDEI